jgi:hypothetical protein
MPAHVARCENCGAALRLEGGQTSAKCDYCGVTSGVAGDGARTNAPRLRVAAPPPAPGYDNAVRAPIGVAIFLAAAIYLAIAAARAPTGAETAPTVFALVCGALALLLGLAGVMAWKGVRQVRRLRETGYLGRATVERISSSGTGQTAVLTLKIEVSGQPTRGLDHQATIPALLMPRVTSGLVLPVIVDREDSSRIEIAWHLL